MLPPHWQTVLMALIPSIRNSVWRPTLLLVSLSMSLLAWPYTETGSSSPPGSFKMIQIQFKTQGSQNIKYTECYPLTSYSDNHFSLWKIFIFRQARHNKSLVDVAVLPTVVLLLIGMYFIYLFSRATGKNRKTRNITEVSTFIFVWQLFLFDSWWSNATDVQLDSTWSYSWYFGATILHSLFQII